MDEVSQSKLHPKKRAKNDHSFDSCKLRIEDLKFIDDDGEFDRMVEKARKQSNGNKNKECEILTEIILSNLFLKIKNDRNNKSESPPSIITHEDDTLERKFPQFVNEDEVKWPTSPPLEMMSIVRKNGLSEPVLVIRKAFSKSDLCQHQARFSMPIKKVTESDMFLKREEREALDQMHKYEGRVVLVELRHMKMCEMELKKWKQSYMITKNWGRLLKKYMHDDNYYGVFEEGRCIQIWGFRKNDDKELWLALQVVD